MKKMILLASLVTIFTMSAQAAIVRCEVEESGKGYTVEIDTNKPNPRSTQLYDLFQITTTTQNYVSLSIDKRSKEMSIIQMAADRKNTFEAVGSDAKAKLFWLGSSTSLLVECELVK